MYTAIDADNAAKMKLTIPPAYDGVLFGMIRGGYLDDLKKKMIWARLKQPNRWLFIYAEGNGNGKTSLATAAISKPYSGFDGDGDFLSWEDLVFEKCIERQEAMIIRAKCAPLLLFDDVKVIPSKRSLEDRAMLIGIIKARYNAGLPTVITTNLTPESFEAEFGPDVMDRLKEKVKGSFIEVPGCSFRKLTAEDDTLISASERAVARRERQARERLVEAHQREFEKVLKSFRQHYKYKADGVERELDLNEPHIIYVTEESKAYYPIFDDHLSLGHKWEEIEVDLVRRHENYMKERGISG